MAGPRSLFGRLLKTIRDGVSNQQVISPERQRLRDRLPGLRGAANELPFAPLKAHLLTTLDTVAEGDDGMDALPDSATRASRLMQMIGSADDVESRITLAQGLVGEHAGVTQALDAARETVVKITDEGQRTPLAQRLQALDRALTLSSSSTNPKDLSALPKLAGPANALRDEVANTLKVQKETEERLAREEQERLQREEQERLEREEQERLRLEQERLRLEQEQKLAAAKLVVTQAQPALTQRCISARALDQTSDTMPGLVLAMDQAEIEFNRLATADTWHEAEAQLAEVTKAALAVETQAAKDDKAYADALGLARTEVGKLVKPVIADEKKLIEKDYVAAAETLATGANRKGALALLAQVAGECVKAQGLATAYEQALAAAKLELSTAAGAMYAVDATVAQTQMIDAAVSKAAAGKRQDALDLLGKVKPHCDEAKSKSIPSNFATWLDGYADLMKHPQAAAFATEIAALGKRHAVAIANAKAGTNKAVEKELGLLYWDAHKQIAFANQHTDYVSKRDAAQLLVKQFQDAAPATSNAAVDPETKAMAALVEHADKQAAKRLYELALADLAQLDKDRLAAITLKQDHAAYATELLRVQPLVTGVPDVPGTPGATEAASLRTRLAQAKALADPARDFKGALAQLTRIGSACDACSALGVTVQQDVSAHDTALLGLDSDTAGAMAAVRLLLDQLKTRPGHEGITQQLADIEQLLVEANTALTN